jgi:hypothetical protein
MRPVDHHTAELLRAVALDATTKQRDSIAELAKKIPCWEDAFESARVHGLLPMLYLHLRAINYAVVPGILEKAKREFERNAFHCMANAAELLQVLNAFELASISAMPFKGVVLAASAYGDITMRPAGDVDLLVYPGDLKCATAILLDRGYDLTTAINADGFPAENDTFELHFERPSDGMVMELRWRLELTTPRFRRALGMDWIWSKRTTAQLAGADVPNLDAISALLVLCMHGSKHKWSRLIWICDVAKLLSSELGLNWDTARQEAKRVGLWRCLALGVLLAHKVAGAEVSQDVLREFRSDRPVRELAEFFAEHLPEEPGKTPEGRMPYNMRLLGVRDRARVLLSLAFLKPNERDRAAVRLPKALDPLYYLLRPFRILLDRTARH